MAQEAEQTIITASDAVSKVKSTQPKSRKPFAGKSSWIVGIVGALLIGMCGGIMIGMQIGKSSIQPADGMASNGQMQQPDGGDRQDRGTTGTVTAVSSNSITIKSTRGNTETTYTITSSTTVTDNGSSASVSDIEVGDTVRIQVSTSDNDSTTATNIEINPTENADRGGPGGNAPTSAGDAQPGSQTN